MAGELKTLLTLAPVEDNAAKRRELAEKLAAFLKEMAAKQAKEAKGQVGNGNPQNADQG